MILNPNQMRWSASDMRNVVLLHQAKVWAQVISSLFRSCYHKKHDVGDQCGGFGLESAARSWIFELLDI